MQRRYPLCLGSRARRSDPHQLQPALGANSQPVSTTTNTLDDNNLIWKVAVLFSSPPLILLPGFVLYRVKSVTSLTKSSGTIQREHFSIADLSVYVEVENYHGSSKSEVVVLNLPDISESVLQIPTHEYRHLHQSQ